MDTQDNSTAHLIDTEPVLILGCSNGEIMSLAGFGFISGIVIGVLLAMLVGYPLVAVPFPVIGAFSGVVKGGKTLGKKKEGKPDGYYSRLGKLFLSKMLTSDSFIHRHGPWRIRR